jgi:molybdopterin-guanine dinucleotide biosynthesis protein A
MSGRGSLLPITGFVLAGGTSRRMGRDKTKLVLGGEKMVERQLHLLGSVCGSVAILGPPKSLNGFEASVLPDELPGRGPLGGLYTGLLWTSTEFNLFLGCDLPFMESSFLQFLCKRALHSRADVTVPMSRGGRFEPLAAVYRRRVLRAIRKSLKAGENKVTGLFLGVRCEAIPWGEIVRAGFGPRIFDNMNTLEDYAAARQILK